MAPSPVSQPKTPQAAAAAKATSSIVSPPPDRSLPQPAQPLLQTPQRGMKKNKKKCISHTKTALSLSSSSSSPVPWSSLVIGGGGGGGSWFRRCCCIIAIPIVLLMIQSIQLSLSVTTSNTLWLGGGGGGGTRDFFLLFAANGSSSSSLARLDAQVLLETLTGQPHSSSGQQHSNNDDNDDDDNEPRQLREEPSLGITAVEYFNRYEVQDVLQHPHKSHPSSRHRTITTGNEEDAVVGNDVHDETNSPTTKNKNNITWLSLQSAPGIADCTMNALRVQDFLQQHEQQQNNNAKQETTTNQVPPPPPPQQQQPKPKQDNKPLNIVLLYADDWTMQVLGALNSYVQTPHIDAMARRGMLFTRNCVTTSICWISRNTLATGVYSSVHGNNRISETVMFHHDRFDWNNHTLYALLKQHGYFTGLVGKWHAPSPRPEMQASFDIFKDYYGSHWMNRNGQRRHVTDLNGEDALAFLKLWNYKHGPNRPVVAMTAAKAKPFFLKVSFFATHARDNADPPYEPMTESLTLLYQDRNLTIPRPKTATERHYQALPPFMKFKRNQARKRNLGRFDTAAHYQEQIKNLYRMATEVDAVVGAIVAELKAMHVYDHTLLIFTTDNGNLHGEHGLTEKWYPYEESIRVPLVIQDPRMPRSRRGTINRDDFTLNIDLPPTILSAAQIPIPPHMQGRDIADLYRHELSSSSSSSSSSSFLLEGNKDSSLSLSSSQHAAVKASWRQDFFYEWNTGDPRNATGHRFGDGVLPAVFALIRKDYKYFYWPEANYEQLFHIQEDPYEERDIFRDTSTTTQQALTVMRARYRFLKAWAQAGNPV